jgi:eukaryotic-like serine/threonine-protein kinase
VTASVPPTSSDPRVGTVLGRHVLVRLLGEGGMGAVYQARHQDLGRPAALKVLHERYARSADVRLRFVREGQAAARVRHPNVVDVYDVGVEGNEPYLVMELLEGEDLSQTLAREGALSVARTADLLLPVVAAVAAAHDIGVVHRDLKPENIFLSDERGGVRPKVLDFGISKLMDPGDAQPLTGTGAFLGTPQYMSPEQAQGAKYIDHRSDQYSLGVILYQCATGRRPIEEPSIYTLIQRIVRGEFPPPRQLSPELPAAFEAVILRAMARDPSERFVSVRALGRALLEFASARGRVLYADELSLDEHAVLDALGATALDPSKPRPQISGLGTTLGDSVSQGEPRAPQPTRLWLGILAGLVIGLVALFVRRTPSPPAATPSAAAANAGLGVPPALSPTPSGEAAPQPLPSVNAAPAVSASSRPAASAEPGGAMAPKRPLPPKPAPHAPHSDRPTLAPR